MNQATRGIESKVTLPPRTVRQVGSRVLCFHCSPIPVTTFSIPFLTSVVERCIFTDEQMERDQC